MRSALLLVLTGCNAVFGLAPTAAAPPIDAQYFDGPPDAPYACPTSGAPVFSPYLQQAYVQPECHDYNAARDGFAVAMCMRPAQLTQGAFVAIPELSATTAYGPPRITPEGDQLFLVAAGKIAVLTRAGTSWSSAGSLALPFALATNAAIGVPSAGPQRHLMLVNNDSMIHELVIDANGTATEAHVFTDQDLGVQATDAAPSLTPDGLHIVFVALDGFYPGVYYASRPDLASPFTPAATIAAAGNVSDPFITADCGHLFFSVVGSVVYVKQ